MSSLGESWQRGSLDHHHDALLPRVEREAAHVGQSPCSGSAMPNIQVMERIAVSRLLAAEVGGDNQCCMRGGLRYNIGFCLSLLEIKYGRLVFGFLMHSNREFNNLEAPLRRKNLKPQGNCLWGRDLLRWRHSCAGAQGSDHSVRITSGHGEEVDEPGQAHQAGELWGATRHWSVFQYIELEPKCLASIIASWFALHGSNSSLWTCMHVPFCSEQMSLS